MGEALGRTRSERSAFGATLRSMRLAAGLSQGALAERAGLSEKAVGTLERGDRTTPRPATVVLLADAVSASPAEQNASGCLPRPTPRGGRPREMPPIWFGSASACQNRLPDLPVPTR
jgi:transcriptional regulator with XRE-family HTH domain